MIPTIELVHTQVKLGLRAVLVCARRTKIIPSATCAGARLSRAICARTEQLGTEKESDKDLAIRLSSAVCASIVWGQLGTASLALADVPEGAYTRFESRAQRLASHP